MRTEPRTDVSHGTNPPSSNGCPGALNATSSIAGGYQTNHSYVHVGDQWKEPPSAAFKVPGSFPSSEDYQPFRAPGLPQTQSPPDPPPTKPQPTATPSSPRPPRRLPPIPTPLPAPTARPDEPPADFVAPVMMVDTESVKPVQNNAVRRWNTVRKSLSDQPAIILVMGATGVGKSSFLTAFGAQGFKSGHTLHSETREPTERTAVYKSRRVTLVDTPGFGDTDQSDANTLRSIADWLFLSHKRGERISGIIYVHRITDNRLTGTAVQNIKMFEHLCGPKALANSVLCTSFWDAIDEPTGIQRERELGQYWSSLTRLGARIVRHDNTPESAQSILDLMLNNKGITLQIQEELTTRALQDTEAGKLVLTDIEKLELDFIAQVEELDSDAREARLEQDQQMIAIVEDDRTRLLESITRLQEEKIRLESGIRPPPPSGTERHPTNPQMYQQENGHIKERAKRLAHQVVELVKDSCKATAQHLRGSSPSAVPSIISRYS